MSLLNRLPWRRLDRGEAERSSRRLAAAEAALRAGAAVSEIQRHAAVVTPHNDVERGWLALMLGELDLALEHSYSAASERPYDVDSRVVHGTVRLARNELEHAAHEFEAIIEEFGAEGDAMDGRRAVILAHGFAPLDELPATESDWARAATLATTLWRLAGIVDARIRDLEGGHADGRAILGRALEDGLAKDREAGDGTV